jgi:hypothetical protein
MTISYYEQVKTAPPSAHYVGKQPSKSALSNARETLLGLTSYRGCAQLGQFVGPAAPTRAGANDCNFYIIFPALEPAGVAENVRIAADVQCWDEYNAANVTVTWDAAASETIPVNSVAAANDTTQPAGLRRWFAHEVAYNQNAVTDTNASYGYTKLRVEDATIAHMSAFTIPRTTNAYRNDTPDDLGGGVYSFNQQFGLREDTFNVNMPLIGVEDFDTVSGSMGALCQHQNAQDKSRASMVSSSAPCVFQYCHPAGIYVAGAGSTTYQNIFGTYTVDSVVRNTLVKAKGRNLLGGNKNLDLAVIGRWDASANCTIKIWTQELDGTAIANSTHTLNAAGAATPTLEVNDAFIEYDPDGTEIMIAVASDASSAIEIQSIALFERSMGDTV